MRINPGYSPSLTWDQLQAVSCVVACSYAGYKEVPAVTSGLTQLTSLKLENQCFESSLSQSPASSHAGRLLPLRKLKTLSLGSW